MSLGFPNLISCHWSLSLVNETNRSPRYRLTVRGGGPWLCLLCPMLMCRVLAVLERGETDQRDMRQMAAPVSSLPLYSQSSPRLAQPRSYNASHLTCGESCGKSLRNRLVQTFLGCVVVNYMSRPMQGMQQLRVGR